MLNVREMMTGDMMRLTAVMRFNNAHRSRDESVMEHVGVVSMYAALLAVHVTIDHRVVVDWLELMLRATMHDIEESVTGDFPRSFKYRDATTRASLEATAGECADEIFTRLGFHDLVDMWDDAKDDDTEGRIVSMADFLSTVAYIHRESAMGNTMIVRDTMDIIQNWDAIASRDDMVELFGNALMEDVRDIIADVYDIQKIPGTITIREES